MRLFKKDVIVDEGRISIKKQTNRKPCRVHQHEFIELVYVTAGSGIHVIDDVNIGYPAAACSLSITASPTVSSPTTQMLFAWLLRKMNSDTTKVIHDSVQDVLDYINEHFSEKLELSDIAARGFYNPDYLSKLLKKYCGKSYSQYVKEKRIAQAAQLIQTTNLSVSEIMLQCGYTDSKIFYKHFKEIYGEVPGGLRRK